MKHKPYRAPAPQQEEFWDTKRYNARLLHAIACLIGGDEREQRLALDDVIDMVDDVVIARRVVTILDMHPHLKDRLGSLYTRAKSNASP